MPRAAVGPPNAKRRPGQEAAFATNQTSDQHSPSTPDATEVQRAARHLSRRFALRMGLATVIAGEIGLGGAQ
jgi:hypothetical protein